MIVKAYASDADEQLMRQETGRNTQMKKKKSSSKNYLSGAMLKVKSQISF